MLFFFFKIQCNYCCNHAHEYQPIKLHMNFTEFTAPFSNVGLTSYVKSLMEGFALTHDGYARHLECQGKLQWHNDQAAQKPLS